MTDQVFIAPTFMCAATMAAAVDAGEFEQGRRALVIANNAAIPEVTPALHEHDWFKPIADRFDAIAYLNDYIAPHHPRTWRPRKSTMDDLAGRIRIELGIGPDPRVVSQSLLVRPALALAQSFGSGPITAVSDGLMAYGRGRLPLATSLADRLDSLLYLDLLPDVAPRLFAELEPSLIRVGPGEFRAISGDVAAHVDAASSFGTAPDALILGQYLADLELLTDDEEEYLHAEMVRAAHALGASTVAFKPHPSSVATVSARMAQTARSLGLEFQTIHTRLPLEVLLETWQPQHVISNFSTGLATASGIYGLEAHTVGALDVARALPTETNSNLVPLALCYAAYPRYERTDEGAGTLIAAPEANLQGVIDALAARLEGHPHPAIASGHTITDPGLVELMKPLTRPQRPPLRKRLRRRIVTTLPMSIRHYVRKVRRRTRRSVKTARDIAAVMSLPIPK
ncbi:polysialyltransferase family glycosyltransferase [Demequina flava]|uniref:polysialyltransferase family glycosyltransferase n=1 Tax=Demequina flava TaxID=1095025 RepID=UPI0007840FDF|nr:polysialyltransferase family glycosyltransferase [Demequina flava]